jgi:hypothetical protein
MSLIEIILGLTQCYTKVLHQHLWFNWIEGSKGAIILEKDINISSKLSTMDRVRKSIPQSPEDVLWQAAKFQQEQWHGRCHKCLSYW